MLRIDGEQRVAHEVNVEHLSNLKRLAGGAINGSSGGLHYFPMLGRGSGQVNATTIVESDSLKLEWKLVKQR